MTLATSSKPTSERAGSKSGKSGRLERFIEMTTPASWIRHIIMFGAVALFSFVIAFVVSHALAKPWEFTLRTTGGVLQVFGVLSVALGIWKLRRTFGLGPVRAEILTELRSWIGQLGRRIARMFGRRRHVIVTASGNLRMDGALLTARAKIGRGPNLSVEQRLEFLERGFDEIQDLTYKLQDDLRKEIDLRTAAIATERADREKVTAEVRSQVLELAVGGIQLQIVGLVCLVFGVALATWSQEFASLF